MLNSLRPDIKFTIECSDKQLPFLDVLVKKEGSKLETDRYYKPTDSKQYLLFNSCHDEHSLFTSKTNTKQMMRHYESV